MEITINLTEWVIYVLVIWVALYAADITLKWYSKWLKWKIKKRKARIRSKER